jgi:hypothetical protein
VLDPTDISAVPGRNTIPASIESKLDFDKEVFGDFLVCPLTHSRPGRMQTICVESGKNLFVRSRKCRKVEVGTEVNGTQVQLIKKGGIITLSTTLLTVEF